MVLLLSLPIILKYTVRFLQQTISPHTHTHTHKQTNKHTGAGNTSYSLKVGEDDDDNAFFTSVDAVVRRIELRQCCCQPKKKKKQISIHSNSNSIRFEYR
jgi:hypothetical protein